MIIYPPHIGDTVPGFIQVNNQAVIKIPFTHNTAVDYNKVTRMRLIIKEFSSGVIKTPSNIIGTKPILQNDIGVIEFTTTEHTFTPGNYYKFQIAYDDSEDENIITAYTYSSVAIGRCVGNKVPELSIEGLAGNNQLNPTRPIYVGIFDTDADFVSEPIYKYCFDLYNNSQDNQLIETSDWQLYKGSMEFISYQELNYNDTYTIKLSIQTVNGYDQSIEYYLVKAGELPFIFTGADLVITHGAKEKDNGCVQIQLKEREGRVTGDYELLRKAEGDTKWDLLSRFTLKENTTQEQLTWIDRSVEHGLTYEYAIRHYSNLGVSVKKVSPKVTVAFEDMFLSDGDKQLKIRFNPKVSSFKDTILEQKTDTIGGKYPFFFRNGQVRYKEIPISGLISYQMDEAEMFMNDEELGLSKNVDSRERTAALEPIPSFADRHPRTTNLVDYNIVAERKFKLAVMEWLTNGRPKLFRSPTEGNYVVRLMQTSLSPNDTLGRMLHTFNSTGYECMDNDYAKMSASNVVPAFIHEFVPTSSFKTVLGRATGDLATQGFSVSGNIRGAVYYDSNVGTDQKIWVTKEGHETQEIIVTHSPYYIGDASTISSKSTTGSVTYTELTTEGETGDAFANLVNTTRDEMFSDEFDVNESIGVVLFYFVHIAAKKNGATINFINFEGLSEEVVLASNEERYYTAEDLIDTTSITVSEGAAHIDAYARIQLGGGGNL